MSEKWRAAAARVSAMSWDELSTRLRQEARKRMDRVLYGAGIDPAARELNPPDGFKRKATRSSSAPVLGIGRFYFETSEVLGILALLRERFPAECDATIQRADRILRHQFDLLGLERLDYGRTIDWFMDPVSQIRAPKRPWYQIKHLLAEEAGDHKILWEINRHQHLIVLAKAHLLTGEAGYLSELLDQWRSWQKDNPYPIGINWTSSLEVAFRSLAWLWVGHLLSASPQAPKAFQHELLRGLALSGRHIARYLSTYSSPNTHLLGEAAALFAIGTLCPRLRSAARWQSLGWRIVMEEAARQVQPDGMHFEQSVYYHVYALDFFLHSRILAARNGISVPAEFDGVIDRMLDFLAGISQAGIPPRFGDDDGGRVFDPRRNRTCHLRDPLSTGAVIYHSPEYKTASKGLKEETLWLLGADAVQRYDAIIAAPSPPRSRAFTSSGLYVQSGPSAEDGRERCQLVIDAGPQGTGNSGHGHADALSIQLSSNSRAWLTDPGAFRYISPGSTGDRDRYRGTAAHNTLSVDGLDQAEPAGPFAWTHLPETSVDLWTTGDQFDLFCGTHRGYARLADPVIHRRWVFWLKGKFWLVRDVAEGGGEHALEIPWHFAPGFTALYTPPGFTLMGAGDGTWRGLAVVPVESHGWSQEVRRGGISPAYGIEELAPVVRYSARLPLPCDFAAILQPVRDAPERQGRFTRRAGENATEYCYQWAGECHRFFFCDGGQPWETGIWKSDAGFIYMGTGAGSIMRLAFCNGSFLDASGQRVLACTHPVERWESDGIRSASSNQTASMEFAPERMQWALEASSPFDIVK